MPYDDDDSDIESEVEEHTPYVTSDNKDNPGDEDRAPQRDENDPTWAMMAGTLNQAIKD